MSFWSDNGRHFKSSKLSYFLLKTAPKQFKMSEVTINYFGKCHDKFEVDDHFRVLSRLLKQAERERAA